jgi:hypothetical protein
VFPYRFIIPDAEASDRGFKTHGGETLSESIDVMIK